MGLIGKIILGMGIFILLVSIGTAIAGIVMMIALESDESTINIETDEGGVTQFAGCNFYLLDDSIFIGMGMILASIPVSVLGLALIIIGRFPEKSVKQEEQFRE